MVWGCSRANSIGDWHMCEGTIDMEAYIGIVKRYTAIKMMSFMGSPWLLDQDKMPALILHVLQPVMEIRRYK